MSDLQRAVELFVDVGLEAWMEQAARAHRQDAETHRHTEARAKVRARLEKCVTMLQRVHEIDARRDLLLASPGFPGRERCLERLDQLRRQVLAQVRRGRQVSG